MSDELFYFLGGMFIGIVVFIFGIFFWKIHGKG